MKYRVMARMYHDKRHHQEGPEYETRADAQEQAKYWDGIVGSIAHVEEVPLPRRNHHREATT